MPITNIEQPLPTFDFKKESDELNALVSGWTDEETKCKTRREIRENRKSVHEERQKKVILEDETIIPDRTVNSSVRRSRVPYANYVKKSKRTLIITEVEAPQISIETLELWYTRGMRYPKWKSPWNKLIDGMLVHGGCAMEVIYDESKPLNCALEYIPREWLIFPVKARNLQTCPRLLRLYEISATQLEEFTLKYGFNEKIAKDLMDKFHKQDTFIKVYRELMKVNGVVYNAWWSKENNDDWLRAPVQHDIGLFDFDPAILNSAVPAQQAPQQTMMPGIIPMQQPASIPLFLSPEWEQMRGSIKPLPLKAFPIFWFPFQEVENEILLDIQGRVSLDMHVQEAMTSLLTDTVNGTHRASQFFPFVKAQPGDDPKLAELQPMRHGSIMSREIGSVQLPYPSPIILAVLQALKIGKADDSGQLDFAATARKDANKTARELELATQQGNEIQGEDADIFSSAVLDIYALCFNIACHQSIMDLCKKPVHPELLVGDYNLQPAGDVEVVKREEDKANAKEFFNIVQGTPTAEKILKFLIERFFPDQADEWLAALEAPDKNAIIQQLINILQQVPQDELPPEVKLGIGNIIAAAQSMVGADSNQGVPSNAPPAKNGNSQPMSAA